jgi:hypothetical protein
MCATAPGGGTSSKTLLRYAEKEKLTDHAGKFLQFTDLDGMVGFGHQDPLFESYAMPNHDEIANRMSAAS